MGKAQDLTGKVFTDLTVMERAGTDKHRRALWLCRCSCGAEVIVPARQLIIGSSKSCGHRQRNFFVENGYRAEATHGMSNTKLYGVWSSIKYRCLQETSKDYPDYGGRGITICDEWRDNFEAFMKWALENGYIEGLTIDRKDVNGPYCPENCRWITNADQADNKRSTVYITVDGVTHTVTEWAALTGIKAKTIKARIKKGWSPEKALHTPVAKKETE